RNSLDTINGNINATFGPMFRAGCNDRFASIQLLIYSRWGNLVYDSCEGQPMPCTRLVRWDGTDNSGNPLPPDTYIYVAQYQIRSVSGGRSYEMERESGEVLLLR
ncbi:MAG: gliding motility-associated C-terminal domain-containing protein, partial [Bacteroidota bacterium]